MYSAVGQARGCLLGRMLIGDSGNASLRKYLSSLCPDNVYMFVLNPVDRFVVILNAINRHN